MSATTGDPRLVEGGFAAVLFPEGDDGTGCQLDPGTAVRVRAILGEGAVVSTSSGKRARVELTRLTPVDLDYVRAVGWHAFDPEVYPARQRFWQGVALVLLVTVSALVVTLGLAALVGLIR